ncbi:non-specific lipid transfer protein GPI-anchored 16-like isoform X3 [Quercus robur]|uniref:non-specific lipid transfer protein GPI-anchored 16-like isoform X3 n=1 Tax=Quercus robur TaxID=38942 RepID=UPI0021638C12|nr:non-specific lipid transfer protein GPI-anchored 16-like isoform X3 [Quercus robur]
METIKGSRLIAISATLLVISAILVKGQIRTPCTTSMINSFTPCFNFITGSSNNGSSPTSECCSSLQSLTSTSVDCACLVLTANVPVLPINRTLALSLPQACNMAVPVQCKASSAPLPAPGTVSLGPSPSPIAASPLSPRASKAVALAPAPQSDTTLQLTPASPPVETKAPTTNPGIRPVLTPPASASSYVSPAPLLALLVGIMVF